jgi:hypothetical protein
MADDATHFWRENPFWRGEVFPIEQLSQNNDDANLCECKDSSRSWLAGCSELAVGSVPSRTIKPS